MRIITDQSQFFRWCQRLWSVLYSSTILFLAFLRELDLLSDYQSGFRKNMVRMGLEKSLKKHHFLEKSFIKKVFCTKERFESTAICKFS